jgi:putative ABC transport system permease protein
MTPIPGRRWIAWASRLVPISRRGQWRREWEAEVAYAWRRISREGAPSWPAVLRLQVRIATCTIDALWERKETMTMTGLSNDLKHAVRSLSRYPAFTAIAVLTLALGIGANTAVFTLVDGVLLSPLPFDHPEELVEMRHQGRDGQDELPMSDGMYQVYKDQASALEAIALWTPSTVTLVAEGVPERIPVQVVSPAFFSVLRTDAALGRGFVEEEGLPDGEAVVVLSDGFWQSALGSDPQAIGTMLDINGTMRRVVGVMPPGFGFPDTQMRMWLPYVVDPNRAPLAAFGANAIARLAPGSSVEALGTEAQGLIGRLPELFPESPAVSFLQEVGLESTVYPLRDALVGDIRSTLWVLLGTVGFVLLIACANVANLLLVRAEGRQRELALRVAVGAGRGHVLRAFMSESLVLATVGGALGVAIASLAVRTSLRLVPTNLPRVEEIGVDGRVLLFTAAIALGCAAFFGVFPLLRSGMADLAGQLREGSGHGSTGGRQHHRLRNALVVVQMALALVLLIGSGLMLRSFQALRAVDPGYDVEGILTARVTVPTAELESVDEAAGFYDQLRDRLSSQPGVIEVGFGSSVPLGNGAGFFAIEVEDHPRGPDELPVFGTNIFVGPGYLEAMGIDLISGRTFMRGDGALGVPAVVVSRSFAQEMWPGQSALGRHMRLGPRDEPWSEIIGVVEDVHFGSLEDEPEQMVYWPLVFGAPGSPRIVRGVDVAIRAGADPLGFVSALRREVQALNPRIPIASPRAMEDLFDDATSRVAFTMTMLGAASGIALLLGLVGIYGVISYVVQQRTREIGVRMALGAAAATVRGMVVRQGLALASAGVVLGLIAAGALSSVMGRLLFGVAPIDPVTYGAVSVALVLVATLACWIPALRAAGVDPSTALRAE